MLDGQLVISGRLYMKYCQLDKATMFFTTQLILDPGSHIFELQVAALDAESIPEGPREWSPRKRKKEPTKAIVHASSADPVVLRVVGIE